MISAEFVRLKNDTNYIPIKYQVVEVSVGSDATTTNLWLKQVSYGVDTEENLKKILNEYYYSTQEVRDLDQPRSEIQREGLNNLQGKINQYTVASLDSVSSYSRPNFEGLAQVSIG